MNQMTRLPPPVEPGAPPRRRRVLRGEDVAEGLARYPDLRLALDHR